ncbi:proline--tRNA ligase [Candidatus Babeliales bacterium]|nr:proline--tRNA ligase [Candidatus Babeliales bacterium]
MMKKLPDLVTSFPEWYQEVIYQAELADQSPVRGSMVIRPYGTALWENIKNILDKKIKDTGHQNAIFPLLIPMSFLKKEAEHVEGFAPELAVVTHAGGKELDEPYVIRPTSETIIHYMFAQWIKSWRDLPMKINQWANVMRWELRPRAFLRTSEFFWQEGHTAHETAEEAHEEALLMLNQYIDLCEKELAIPIIAGAKSESEKFAGADKTYTLEGIMQDGKALQMCTSHLISQSFAKAFGMQFQDKTGALAYPYLTSWGATTRLIGAMVMTHGDNKGLIMPPRVAPIQVVIIPIMKKGADEQTLLKAAGYLKEGLEKEGIRVRVDADTHETPGSKFYKWEMKGVPIRIEIGPRDLLAGTVLCKDRLGMSKESIALNECVVHVTRLLDTIQNELFKRACARRDALLKHGELLEEFGNILAKEPGAYITGWCQDPLCEEKFKPYKATIRCLLKSKDHKVCCVCHEQSLGDIILARAY